MYDIDRDCKYVKYWIGQIQKYGISFLISYIKSKDIFVIFFVNQAYRFYDIKRMYGIDSEFEANCFEYFLSLFSSVKY